MRPKIEDIDEQHLLEIVAQQAAAGGTSALLAAKRNKLPVSPTSDSGFPESEESLRNPHDTEPNNHPKEYAPETAVSVPIQEPKSKSKVIENPTTEGISTTAEASMPTRPRQQKIILPDYRATFLVHRQISTRSGIYVSQELRDKLTDLLPRIGGRNVTVTGYIENILWNHLEVYRDEINRLYREQNKATEIL